VHLFINDASAVSQFCITTHYTDCLSNRVGVFFTLFHTGLACKISAFHP